MKILFLCLLTCVTGLVNKISAQDNYSLSTVKMSFSYSKKTTGKGSTTMIITGNNSNAPMLQGLNGSIIVSSKNNTKTAQPSGSSAQSNPATQMPVGAASAYGSSTYNKFFIQANQDHSLNGTMSYTSNGDRLKGVPDINFVFNYDPGNKMGNIGVGGFSATVHTETEDGATKTVEGSIGGGVGAITDITQSMYGYSGMKKDSNATYMNLTKTKTGYRISYFRETKQGEGETAGTTTEDLIAFIGDPDGIYEAAITPYNFDYANWLPTGPTVDGKGDTRGDLTMKFVPDVYLQGHPDYKYPGKFSTSWRLGNVTNYPGICNNYPEYTQSPDVTADLIFNPDMKTNPVFSSVSNTDVNTISCFSTDAPVNVICKDYAAWGKLSAVITLDNGSTVTAISSAEPGKQYLTIPLDKDENKLADAWEETYNTDKHPLTWDGDALPAEQRETGDGYTLFEEYRGFAIHINANADNQTTEREDFARTDPNKKDAFVYDKDGLFKDNYESANPSDIQWHYLSADKKQLLYYPTDIKKDGSRWVNFNKVSDYFYSQQYCMVIMYSDQTYSYDPLMTACSFTKAEYDFANNPHPTYADSVAYNEGTDPSYSTKSPMKRILKIEILRNAISNAMAFVQQASGAAVYATAVKNKIATSVKHEVGHAMGIRHHQAPTNAPSGDGHDEQSAAANDGAVPCLMRYYNLAERSNVQQQLVVRDSYCRKGDSGPYYYRVNTRNAQGKVTSYTEFPAGTKQGDNCYGQITVKSKPGE